MADDKRTTVWVDANGRNRATYMRTLGSGATLVSDLLALSNADVQEYWNGPPIVNGSPAPTAAVYQNVADYAVLVFQTAAPSLVYLTLVCPKSSIFYADGETVNPVAIATLITDATGKLEDDGGNIVTGYVGGFRRRSGREYQ